MSGPGNDPFSGSSIQNVLQHTISPKIVTDGSGGYTVKADLINLDNVYLTGNIYSNNVSIPAYYSVKALTSTGSFPSITFYGGSVAIGQNAGITNQGVSGTAVGWSAGQIDQGNFAIAIGTQAGQSNQGTNSIAIGNNAGSNQPSNSIVIDATGSALTTTVANTCVISPIRQVSLGDVPAGSVQVYWNPTTGELMAVTP